MFCFVDESQSSIFSPSAPGGPRVLAVGHRQLLHRPASVARHGGRGPLRRLPSRPARRTRVRRPRSSPWPLQPRDPNEDPNESHDTEDLCGSQKFWKESDRHRHQRRGSKAKHEGGVQSHVWGGVTAGLLVHDDLARRCSCVKENKGHTPRQDERERRPAGCHHLWRAIGRGVALQHERCAGCGGLCGDRGLEGNRGRED